MKNINNFNNIKEIKTTVIGLVLFCMGIYWFGENIHGWQDATLSNLYVPVAFTLGGIFFMLAPDKILNFLFKRINKDNNQPPTNQ